MICAEFFGCSGKLDFLATRELVTKAGAKPLGDFSISRSGTVVMSIDRVAECSNNAQLFADIAVAHACRDLEAGFATPTDMLVCFEFEEGTGDQRQVEIVRAIMEAAKKRNIVIGKCHSVFVEGPTSLVFCVCGNRQDISNALPAEGAVWLSHGLGAAKIQYMTEIGTFVGANPHYDKMINSIDTTMLTAKNCVLSDVSGHGLVGTLMDLAERCGISIEVTISPRTAIAREVITEEITLLANEPDAYGPLVHFDERAKPLALLKETAGPLVALCVSEARQCQELSRAGWTQIGAFKRGQIGARIRWSE